MDAKLLVDQRSGSQSAPEEQIRAWASGRRVFVSSLITDMPAERSEVRGAIESIGGVPVMFEDLGAQDISAEHAYLSGVRSADIYVGLWGARYGVRMPDGYSATHAEFLEAERQGLRLCLFVGEQNFDDMDGPQRDLIQSARHLYTTSPWNDPKDLGNRVKKRLSDLASQELAPWVRLGRTIFRAQEIVSDGMTISITASVQSSAVHVELARLREQRASGLEFVSPHEAHVVQITELSTRTVSTIGHQERIVLTARARTGGSGMRPSMNGLTADEVTRRSVADGLFGTTTLGQTAWLGKPVDPLEPLRSLLLDDSILRPVARLLFTGWLLKEDAASRVESFALGPSHQGKRRLRASWVPPTVYANQPDPEPITVDGTVSDI